MNFSQSEANQRAGGAERQRVGNSLADVDPMSIDRRVHWTLIGFGDQMHVTRGRGTGLDHSIPGVLVSSSRVSAVLSFCPLFCEPRPSAGQAAGVGSEGMGNSA